MEALTGFAEPAEAVRAVREAAASAGVPVQMMSPGTSGTTELTNAICSAIEKIICEVRDCCCTSPLSVNVIARSCAPGS